MNPLTDLDFWLNLGNLFAATAVALFAIKSGYIDKKYDDTKALEDELSSKYDLTHFIDDDIDKKTFKVLKNALDKLAKTSDEIDFLAECSHYDQIFWYLNLDLPMDGYPAFELPEIEKLTFNISPERLIIFVAVFAQFVNKDRNEGSIKLDLLLKELDKIEKFKQNCKKYMMKYTWS